MKKIILKGATLMSREKFIYKTYNSEGGCYGTTTDVYMLPVGTKFEVINGYWKGRIIEENGIKMIEFLDVPKKLQETANRKKELKKDVDYGLVISIKKR